LHSNTNSSTSRNGNNSYFVLQEDDICDGPESFLLEEGVQEEMEEGIEINDPNNASMNKLDEIKRMSMTPSTLAIVKRINNSKGQFIYKLLLDHGGSHVLIKQSALPNNIELYSVEDQLFNTAAGGLKANSYVWLHDVILPEFSFSRQVKTFKA
jgi:hypothetical protein